MHILVVTPYYAPDLGPSAPMVASLCSELVKLGIRITVITCVPHFPTGTVSNHYRSKLFHREYQDGVDVLRVRIPGGNRSNLVHRLWVFIIFQVLSVFAGLRTNPDLLLITNPALETFLPFIFLSKGGNVPVLYCVWDLYPDVGIHTGLFSNPFVIGLVKFLENYCLSRSSRIQVFSSSFKRKLGDRGVEQDKIIQVIPWVDESFLVTIPRDNPFSKAHSLTDHLVIMYAGNMGFSQELEDVIYAAEYLLDCPKYFFLLIGDGIRKKHLESLARGLHLDNIKFLPFQEKDIFPQVLASADIQLVSQKSGMGGDSIPSKLFPILASGRPVIVHTDLNTDAAHMVSEARAGICVPPGDARKLAGEIKKLGDNRSMQIEMGGNGRMFIRKNASTSTATRKFIETFNRMAEV